MTITASRIAYIDAPSSAGGATTGPVGVALPTGAYLAVFVGSSGGGSVLTLADSKGNTWHKRQDASNANSPSAVGDWFTTDDTGLSAALTATDTFTATSTAGSGCGDILVVKLTPDAGNTIAYNNGSVGSGTGIAPAVASFTPGAGNFVLVGLCESSATLNSATQVPPGWSKIAGIDAHVRSRSVVAMYKTAAAAGATTTPFTSVAPAQQYACAAVSFIESAPPAAAVTEFARNSYNGTATKTLAGSSAIAITEPIPVGDTAILIWNVPGSSANTEGGTTVTDTKGNVWHVRELAVQTTAPANGQVFIADTVVTTALTTSDKLTPTVDVTGSAVWAYVGLHGVGLTGYDVSEHNVGATNKAFDTGTTAAAAQPIELVIAAWGYTGHGVTPVGLPDGYIALPTQETTTPKIVVLAIAYAFVNATGTRHVTAAPSDNTNHPWTGLVAAYKSISPPPPDAPWARFDGTSWVPSEMVA